MNRKSVRKPNLTRQFDDATSPIAVVSAGFKVLYVNAACCQWLSISSDDALGSRLQYSSNAAENSLSANLAGLCPDPDLFVDGNQQPKSGFIYSRRESGMIWKQANFTPIAGSNGTVGSMQIIAFGPDLAALPSTPDPMESLRSDWHQLLASWRAADSRNFNLASLVGTSDQAKRIRRQVEAVVGNTSDCLFVGPPGSGREHLARTIFQERKSGNSCLVPIHCTIADSQLIQSSIRNWVVEQRETNTEDWLLLLDVDCLEAAGQLELLGYTQLPNFRMRIMATSQSDLLQLAQTSDFSMELALYLDIQTIRLVPLTDRVADIPLLAQLFIESKNSQSGKQISRVSAELAERLCEYNWPRNTDELKQMIESAHDRCSGSIIQLDDMPDGFHHGLSAARIGYRQVARIDLDHYLAEIEKELIARAIVQSRNNRTQAAKLLGISRARLLRRCAATGLIEPSKDVDLDDRVDASAFKEAD